MASLALESDSSNLLDIRKTLEASKTYLSSELKKKDDLLILLNIVDELSVITKLPRSSTRF